ncbi:ATP-dependent nuclease [Acinetobacter sp. AS167]|uniref:ATP-dependent nuclease n=1 Tax=Acinetobacter sp. AS167 TaxID=3127884 RepID=UPI0030195CBB
MIIEKLILNNFKKFESLELSFDCGVNTLIGDNETGKSTVLLALDLLLGINRSRVESIGIESLLCKKAVDTFLIGPKTIDKLPHLFVEIWLKNGTDHELNGNYNSKGVIADGIRLEISPIDDDYGAAILEVLADGQPNFPYEYYGVKFKTFGGTVLTKYKKPVSHLAIDSSKIDSEYAIREYTRAVFNFNTEVAERYKFENQYRSVKQSFTTENFEDLNKKLGSYQFAVRSGVRSNLETDLVITEDSIPLENRGKGKQVFVKTEFALAKRRATSPLHVLLLEEPENHLSHINMKKLVQSLSETTGTQLFIATHSSHISSRLDLRRAILFGKNTGMSRLKDLTPQTANFFIKAPDNYVLEFALAKKVILVEGDAEFILLEAFYKKVSGGELPETNNVHIISIGGTSFKRYLELGKLLSIKTAVIRDNDGDYQCNCVDNYVGYVSENGKVFSDKSNSNSTFEISLYEANNNVCDSIFSSGRKTLSVQKYMLSNKAEIALKLLNYIESGKDIEIPAYITEAIKWIRE